MPLIGPEELDSDENDALPIELQYMESGKIREPDVEVRLKLLETLYQVGKTYYNVSESVFCQPSVILSLRKVFVS